MVHCSSSDKQLGPTELCRGDMWRRSETLCQALQIGIDYSLREGPWKTVKTTCVFSRNGVGECFMRFLFSTSFLF